MGELIFTRKANQSFRIDDDIIVRIKEIRPGGEASIAVTAPADVKVLRDNAKNAEVVKDSRFRVRRSQSHGNPWYAVCTQTAAYLHADGELYQTAIDGGYYSTPEAAWQAVELFEGAAK